MTQNDGCPKKIIRNEVLIRIKSTLKNNFFTAFTPSLKWSPPHFCHSHFEETS